MFAPPFIKHVLFSMSSFCFPQTFFYPLSSHLHFLSCLYILAFPMIWFVWSRNFLDMVCTYNQSFSVLLHFPSISTSVQNLLGLLFGRDISKSTKYIYGHWIEPFYPAHLIWSCYRCSSSQVQFNCYNLRILHAPSWFLAQIIFVIAFFQVRASLWFC